MQQNTYAHISWPDYIFLITVSFTSLFSFFLFFDNLIRLLINKIKILGIEYSTYYSFCLSLCSVIIVGGFYYINNPNNEFLEKFLIIMGLAFFTSLAVSVGLKQLLEMTWQKKRKEKS
jgi:hypothetical protein